MHESTGFSIWEYSAIIFAVVVISKLISKKTGTVDVNAERLYQGLEEDISRFSQGVKRGLGEALIGAAFPFIAGYGIATMFGYGHHSAMLGH